MDTTEALAALDAKQDAEQRLAAAADCPPWRHAIFAALMAAMVAAPVLPSAWQMGVLAALLVTVPLIVRSDRRRTGMFVNGYRRGRTMAVTLLILGANMVLYTTSLYRAVELGDHRTGLLLAPIAFAIAYAGSTLWMRVFRREMGLAA